MSDSSVVALKRKLADVGVGVSTTNMETELVVYNMTDLPLALDNGAVDAIALHDPVAASAEKEYGFIKILDLTEDEKFKNEYCCASYITSSIAEEHPEAAAACTDLLEIGDLQEGRNIDDFTADHIAKFEDVPESYTYNADGTFSEVKKSRE